MTNKEAKEIFEWELNNFKYTDNEFVEATKVAIKALEERPKGKWIRTGYLGNGNASYTCSECHCSEEHIENQTVPYCWHCGADMRGDV